VVWGFVTRIRESRKLSPKVQAFDYSSKKKAKKMFLSASFPRLFHLKFNSVHNALTRFRPSRVIFYVVYVSYLSLV